MARGAEQRPSQPQPEQAVQKPTFMDRVRSAMPAKVEGGIFTRNLLRIPTLNMTEQTSPQQPSTPPSERDVQIAHDRYMRGEITREQLEKIRQPYNDAFKRALYKLAGLEPPTPKEKS